jgi:hypothetical protein
MNTENTISMVGTVQARSKNLGTLKRVRTTTGPSIAELSERIVKEEDTLLGDRFLCRGGGMMIVAPSGQGKSSMSFQMATLFSAKKNCFWDHSRAAFEGLDHPGRRRRR